MTARWAVHEPSLPITLRQANKQSVLILIIVKIKFFCSDSCEGWRQANQVSSGKAPGETFLFISELFSSYGNFPAHFNIPLQLLNRWNHHIGLADLTPYGTDMRPGLNIGVAGEYRFSSCFAVWATLCMIIYPIMAWYKSMSVGILVWNKNFTKYLFDQKLWFRTKAVCLQCKCKYRCF